MDKEQVHDVVRSGYAEVARQSGSCCGPTVEQAAGCCGSTSTDTNAETASRLGYSAEDITGAAVSLRGRADCLQFRGSYLPCRNLLDGRKYVLVGLSPGRHGFEHR